MNTTRFKVDIVHWDKYPYQIELRQVRNSAEIHDWCMETFGPRHEKYNNPRWASTMLSWPPKIKIRDEKDLNWFLLRWS